MPRILLAVFLVAISCAAIADNGVRCAQLFTDLSTRSTCVTVLNLSNQEYSDDALREKISQMLYGIGFAEMEARQEKREVEEREAAAADEARLLKHDQCYRLFANLDEREVCKTLRMLSMTRRSDVQMVADVRERLRKVPVSDDERQSIAQAESEYKRINGVRHHNYELFAEAFLRRATPNKPIRPALRSKTVPGSGMAATGGRGSDENGRLQSKPEVELRL